MQCPRCSYLNRPAANFCARCRQPLAPVSPAAPPAMVVCVQCRQPIPFGIQFCDQCGAQQTAVPPIPPVPAPALSPLTIVPRRDRTNRMGALACA
jgi:hypothetical protein